MEFRVCFSSLKSVMTGNPALGKQAVHPAITAMLEGSPAEQPTFLPLRPGWGVGPNQERCI